LTHRAALGTGLAVVMLAAAGTAGAAPPRVQIMVVGRTRTLLSARTVTLRAQRITIGGAGRCSVPSGTALAGLLDARLSLRVTDVAGCDPASMFVSRIGPNANGGQAGWEYKVDRSSPSYGAGDPGGRLRSGEQLLWFWCVSASACQRTLAVAPAAHIVAPGAPLAVRVVGYDDNGHAIAIAGATVQLGSVTAVTGPGGSVTVTAPARTGRYRLAAHGPGLVPSFPVQVTVT
jgi:hypothetical protein